MTCATCCSTTTHSCSPRPMTGIGTRISMTSPRSFPTTSTWSSAIVKAGRASVTPPSRTSSSSIRSRPLAGMSVIPTSPSGTRESSRKSAPRSRNSSKRLDSSTFISTQPEGECIMTTQTVTRPESDQTLEKKIQRLREVYATGPEVGKRALEKVLGELISFASTPRARVESAGRTGVRQGKVSELLFIAPFAPGGAARLRALLQLRDGSFDDTDRVGTVHDMRFVFLDNDTKLLFATAYDGEWDPYIDDFATKITDQMAVNFTACEGC